jgi:hypothetical protein
MFGRRPKFLALAGIRTPHRSARSEVASADQAYDPVCHLLTNIPLNFYFVTLKTFVSQQAQADDADVRTKLRSKFGGLRQCVTGIACARSVNFPSTQLFVLF